MGPHFSDSGTVLCFSSSFAMSFLGFALSLPFFLVVVLAAEAPALRHRQHLLATKGIPFLHDSVLAVMRHFGVDFDFLQVVYSDSSLNKIEHHLNITTADPSPSPSFPVTGLPLTKHQLDFMGVVSSFYLLLASYLPLLF